MSTADAHAFQVCVLDDYANTVARRFANWCVGAIQVHGRLRVALTGGRTARDVYAALAAPGICGHVDWRAVEFYQGDERPVDPSSPQSNWGMAESVFLNPAGVPAANRHRMAGEARDLDEAAREYERLLACSLPGGNAGRPVFDLVFLGVGDNGHVASLFPGTAALDESRRSVVANPVPAIGMTRLTITLPVINAARAVWIISSGAKKAATIRRAIEERDPGLPVVRVVPQTGPLVWLLDAAAAGRLSPHVHA
jgi:6-phosphogluconolactonase